MINVYSPTISTTLRILKYRRYYRLHEGTLIRKATNKGMVCSVANRTLIGTLMAVTVYYDIQISYTMAKRRKGKQRFGTIDRLVMKIFCKRGRTSARGTRSFSSITTGGALQNAWRVGTAFSSSLFRPVVSFSLSSPLSGPFSSCR